MHLARRKLTMSDCTRDMSAPVANLLGMHACSRQIVVLKERGSDAECGDK